MVWMLLIPLGGLCGLPFYVGVLPNMGTDGRKKFRVVLTPEILLVDEFKGLDEPTIIGYPGIVPVLSRFGASQSRMLAF